MFEWSLTWKHIGIDIKEEICYRLNDRVEYVCCIIKDDKTTIFLLSALALIDVESLKSTCWLLFRLMLAQQNIKCEITEILWSDYMNKNFNCIQYVLYFYEGFLLWYIGTIAVLPLIIIYILPFIFMSAKPSCGLYLHINCKTESLIYPSQ